MSGKIWRKDENNLFVNTKALLQKMAKKYPKKTKFDLIKITRDALRIPGGAANNNKLGSGRWISFGDRTSERLYKLLQKMGEPPEDVLAAVLPIGETILSRGEAVDMGTKLMFEDMEQELENNKTPIEQENTLKEILTELQEHKQLLAETRDAMRSFVRAFLEPIPPRKEESK